jgi:hypothetical protein
MNRKFIGGMTPDIMVLIPMKINHEEQGHDYGEYRSGMKKEEGISHPFPTFPFWGRSSQGKEIGY